MPINQLFFENEIKILSDEKEIAPTSCAQITQDAIDWSDAATYVKEYQKLLSDNQLGPALSFAVTQNSINKLLGQDGNQDAIRIYLAYSEADKTIRAFVVACKLNPLTGEFDDYNVPGANETARPANEMPRLENVRPCPHQCGKDNMLNHDYIKFPHP